MEKSKGNGSASKLSLLERWRQQQERKAASTGPTSSGDKQGPLSLGQQRLWFLQQLYPGNPFYHYADIMELRGILQVDALRQSFVDLAEKYPILRTTFPVIEGEVFQQIHEDAQLEFLTQDLSTLPADERAAAAKRAARQSASRPFDLAHGPLTRVEVIQLEKEHHWLVLSMHHIITDKWSMGLLREDLARAYRARVKGEKVTLGSLPHTYLDYANWQRQQKVNEADLAYWLQKLGGELPILKLPIDHTPPAQTSFKGAFHKQTFSPALSRRLQEVANQHGVTLFVLLLTAFKVLLARYSGQKDIIIGTPFSNRDQLSLQSLIGFFNDTLVLRSTLEDDPTFSTLLAQVKQTVLEAFSHKKVPFERLVRELSPERASTSNPLFQVMFLFHKVPETPSMGDDLMLSHQPFDLGVAKFDLTLYVSEETEGLSAIFEYATDLFEEATIIQLQGHFQTLLEGIVQAPNRRIGEYSLLTKAEEDQLIRRWNKWDQPVQLQGSILDLFNQQVAQHPQQLAVVFSDEELTYRELQIKANRVAQWLLQKRIQAGEIVGLHTARSLDMIIGIMGILKAGGAYLPIDPAYPADRIKFILEDAEARWVLSQAPIQEQLPSLTAQIAILSTIYSAPTIEQSIPDTKPQPDQLAYLIYTSGSTGKPKGVQVTHRNLLHSTSARFSFYPTAPERFLLLSSFAFDSSVVGIFWTLCTGGTLVLPKHRIEQDLAEMAALIEARAVSHTLLLPSLYQVLLQDIELSRLKSLHTIIVAGEACGSSLVERHFSALPHTHLYNEYGPTEASVWCTAHPVEPADAMGVVPIGRPIANAEIYILDENLKPLPPGIAGHLYVGGAGVAAGYLHRPALTAAHFLPHPFRPGTAACLYKTGDLAKYRRNGSIDFLGRADRQVKIRGYRIELAEIQTVISQHAAVEDAIVVVRQASGEAAKLIAYFLGDEPSVSQDILRSMREQLPAYMVPAHLIHLATWPRLPNGKLDEKALPPPMQVATGERSSSSPAQTAVQQQLVEIWEEVLGTAPIGIHDNFFEIGGDSILSIQIIAKARKAGIALAANQLFEHQTIAALALFVDEHVQEAVAQSGPLIGKLPLLPIQHWFFEEHQCAPHYWNQGMIFELSTTAEVLDLAAIIAFLVAQHDGLRLSFRQEWQEWRASYLEPRAVKAFEEVDASSWKDTREGIQEFLEMRQAQLDLSQGPLFRAILFRTGHTHPDHLAVVAHHLVIDAVSWKIVVDDLTTLMEQSQSRQTFDLGPKSTSIRDWASYLSDSLAAGKWDEEYSFWSERLEECSGAGLPFDHQARWPSAEASAETLQIQISKTQTEALTQTVHQAYHTKTDEILLAALWKAIRDNMQLDQVTFGLERHGREALDDHFDLVSTVGWFTSFFLLPLRAEGALSTGDLIKQVKEEYRSLPHGGLGYGVLRYLTAPDSPLRLPDRKPDVVFNYLGQQDVPSGDCLRQGQFLFDGLRHEDSERYYALEVNASIKEGQLVLYWTYDVDFFLKSTVDQLMQAFQQALTTIIEHCTQQDIEEYTPSDFPDADISQDDLDNLLGQLNF